MQEVKIDIYISDLLYCYDCVVIPDFGGFVANYTSAKFQSAQHKITPPSKQISFNKHLKNNDGLLSNYLAQKKELTYVEANTIIQSFVNQTLSGLNKGDKIVIEKVGTLFLDPENNIQFKPEEKNDFLLESFGLGAMRVQPIKREGAKERIEKNIEKVVPLIQKEEKKKRKIYWPAAAILIVLLVSSLFLNQKFSWVDTSEVSYSSLGFGNTEAKLYSPSSKDKNFDDSDLTSDELVIDETLFTYKIDKQLTGIVVDNRKEELVVEVDKTAVVNNDVSNRLVFHVMGGCFSSKKNAEKLVSKLNQKGFDARLLGEYKNLYAVSFGSFASKQAAVDLLKEVKSSENKAAWLLNQSF